MNNLIEKYLTEKTKETYKEVIKLSKEFITDIKIMSGKYDFVSIEGVFKNFLEKYIEDLTKIYKRL